MQCICDEDENEVHGVYALDLLEQEEVERRECLAIRREHRLYAGLWLSFYALDEAELVGRDEAGALVALLRSELGGPCAAHGRLTSQGTGFERILLDWSSSQPLATREMDVVVIA